MSESDTQVDTKDQPLIGRRALLGRAGLAAATVGGAALAVTGLPGTADAAAGDPILMGQGNDAGSTGTELGSSSQAGASFVLANSGTAHGPLQLAGSDAQVANSAGMHQGELFHVNGDLFFVSVDSTSPGGSVAGQVLTTANATQQVAIIPKRFLDTRTDEGKSRIVAATLDTAGRLKAGTWLVLDLTELGFYTSVVGNLTAVAPLLPTFLTVAPEPLVGAPTTSTVNCAKGMVLANGFLVAANPNDGSVAIYTAQTTHVLLDVTGVNTPSQDLVDVPVPSISPAARVRYAAAVRRATSRASS